MIKPGELIDFVEMSPLSLMDRRTYNLLLAHAWNRIDQPVTHVIAKSELQGLSRHESTDVVGDSVERLMAAIVRTYVEVDGKPAILRAQLLGSTTEARAPDGLLYYTFSPEMRAIIRDSRIFARLHKDVILQLSSKYSLALYELCKKRVNLEHTWSEEFTVERFRELLGVEPSTLPAFKSFNQRAIQPAVAELNLLCDFGCKVDPVLAGRKVVKLKLSWWRKNEDELKAAYRELQAAKVGRRARMKGTVEKVVPTPRQVAAPVYRPTEARPEAAPAVEPDSLPAIAPHAPATVEQTVPTPMMVSEPVSAEQAGFPADVFEYLLRNDCSLTAYTLPGGGHKVLVLGPAPGVTPSPAADIEAVLHELAMKHAKKPVGED